MARPRRQAQAAPAPRQVRAFGSPPPVPSTMEAIIAARRTPPKPRLNYEAEKHVSLLLSGQTERAELFRRLLNSVDDARSVTGSVRLDRLKAAMLLIDEVAETAPDNIMVVETTKLKKSIQAVNRAFWQFKLDVKSRREQAGPVLEAA